MRVTLVKISISICLTVTVFARPEDSKLEGEIKSNALPELKDLQEYFDEQPDDITRKKKSAITTFCVEIRPTDQKPFQVCEPVPEKGGYSNTAAQGPYYQNSGGYEHLKPQESFNSASSIQSKPAAAYSAPVKTYSSSGINAAAKPAPGYGTYRSTKPEHEEEEEAEKQSPARASKPENADKIISQPEKAVNVGVHEITNPDPAARKTKESDEEEDDDMDAMRAAHHQDPYSYGSGYGTPTSMIPVAPAHHGHSGLVITCQPNLAGYAHGIPGAYHEKLHHGGIIPGYNYRSAGAYGRPYQPYRPQPLPYGSYKPYAARPIYKPQAHVYKGPVYSTPYAHPSPVYKPPVYANPHHTYKPPPAISAEAHELFTSEIKPSGFPPVHAPVAPGSEYAPPAPIYQAPPPPPPPYQPPATYYSPGPLPPAPEYRPAYTPPVDYKPPAYSAAYVPPPTYRAVDDSGDNKVESLSDKLDKEGYTLKKMEEMSQKRAESTRWDSQMSKDTGAREADQGAWRDAEETVGNPQGGWRDSEAPKSAGNWRDSEGAKSAGNWRNMEEALEWRDASEQENGEAVGKSANGAFRNADSSQGMAEGIVSSENKIEEN